MGERLLGERLLGERRGDRRVVLKPAGTKTNCVFNIFATCSGKIGWRNPRGMLKFAFVVTSVAVLGRPLCPLWLAMFGVIGLPFLLYNVRAIY